jgi:hypothetical protein
VEIFGRSEPEAVGAVQLIAENVVGRLTALQVGLREGGGKVELEYYLQGVRIMGFCL